MINHLLFRGGRSPPDPPDRGRSVDSAAASVTRSLSAGRDPPPTPCQSSPLHPSFLPSFASSCSSTLFFAIYLLLFSLVFLILLLLWHVFVLLLLFFLHFLPKKKHLLELLLFIFNTIYSLTSCCSFSFHSASPFSFPYLTSPHALMLSLSSFKCLLQTPTWGTWNKSHTFCTSFC